ncbi:MAG: tRNA pseudouridine(13) synthase TruD [Phycisphaerales bacterium]|nr:tRNA pseudouridine(13) synthase TruD [Phycisphaerales bacterium]
MTQAGQHHQPNAQTAPSSVALAGEPYLTHDVPGTGGHIKARESDFLVEEIPLYEPSGEGEHLYLMIEKTGLATNQLIDVLAAHFGVKPNRIGYAGMKDKRAITRQVVSVHVPGRSAQDFPMVRDDALHVLWAEMHVNKLRRGHLKGNRFAVYIRGIEPTRVLDAERALRILVRRGMPNLFGPQRFGARLNNHILGRCYLLRQHKALLDELLGPRDATADRNADARQAYAEGRYADALALTPTGQRTECEALRALARGRRPSECVNAVNDMQRRFWIAAFQSAVFNRVCMQRLTDGTFDQFMEGDIAARRGVSGLFRVDANALADPTTEQRRVALEISPTGPLWGAKMMEADGAPGALERTELEREGVSIEPLQWAAKTFGESLAGSRRPLRAPVIDPRLEGGVDEHGGYIRCAFELPPGSYATMVMREVMKVFPLEWQPDLDDPADAGG